MKKILQAIDLNKSFLIGTNNIKVIDNITLSIDRGDFVSIMGRSGSGKSSLLNVLIGLLKADSGEIIIEEKLINSLNEKELCDFRAKNFGIVFQDNNLLSNFNVEENIITPLLINKQSIDYQELEQLLDFVGLKEHRHHDIDKLSGGQKQRTAIARALITKPLIIFADEPTGSLDSISAEQIMTLFKKINCEYQTTIIQVTHSVDCAKIGNKIIHLGDGKIIKSENIQR